LFETYAAFLKKSGTKKRLSIGAWGFGADNAQAPGRKSFLLLFLKKEALALLFAAPSAEF